MAIFVPVIQSIDSHGQSHVRSVIGSWTLTTADPTGDDFVIWPRGDFSVHAYGTWGGATLVLEGHNDTDGTSIPIILKDVFKDPMTWVSADDIRHALPVTYAIRPRLSVPGAGATVRAWIVALGLGS